MILKKTKGTPVSLPENPTDEQIMESKGFYCPYCAEMIYPSNVAEFMRGEHDSFIYVHRDVEHDEDYDFSGVIH